MTTPEPAHVAEVISVLDIPSSDPMRLGQMDSMVTYRIDPLHTFSIRLQKTRPSKADIETAVRADWALRKDTLGMKVQL
jgi:hypothetical protein